ncbi:MAG TPA: AraC family transcriptional regulator ligand-binding domain-containing protein [Polyangiaceae bacterium]|nr:AraC family transcriptional regulator ligand-binding domain-containing protein [Polyangiaceae bacterium]
MANKRWVLVQPTLEVAGRYGLSSQRLIEGLSEDREMREQAGLPLEQVVKLWAEIATVARDPAFPFHAAEQLRLDRLGLPGFVILTAPTGRAAFDLAIRYASSMVGRDCWQTQLRDGVMRIDWVQDGEPWLGNRVANEGAVAQTVVGLRQIYGAALRLDRVTFRHSAPAAYRLHQQFFACPVEFGAEADALWFSERVLDTRPPLANPELAAYLQEQAEQSLRAQASDSVSRRLRLCIDRAFQDQEPELRIERYARGMGLSERTLRRKLKEEGTTFRAVLSQAQRATAQHLIQQDNCSLTEIALRVGFSDSSAFSHAMRRWFGRSARHVRRNQSC